MFSNFPSSLETCSNSLINNTIAGHAILWSIHLISITSLTVLDEIAQLFQEYFIYNIYWVNLEILISKIFHEFQIAKNDRDLCIERRLIRVPVEGKIIAKTGEDILHFTLINLS